jgi:hypothetical protein
LGPNPNAAAAAREKGPSGMMVKELMLTDIDQGSDIPWLSSDNSKKRRPARDSGSPHTPWRA